MNDIFPQDEKLYRAVFPYDMYWKEDGSVSSAAFLDRKREGLSVERGNMRDDHEVVDDMRQMNFIGHIVSVTVKNCTETDALVLYRPSKRSSYHSEIHGTMDNPLLSPKQRKYLSRSAIVVDKE